MTIDDYIEQQNVFRNTDVAKNFGLRAVSRDPVENGLPANILVESGSNQTSVPETEGRYNILYINEGDSFYVNRDGSVKVQLAGNPDNELTYTGFSYLVSDAGTRFLLDDDAAEIARLYQVAFGRVPDEAGLEFWLNAFKNKLATKEDIARNFIESPEFVQTFGDIRALSVEDFITTLYDNILDRAPDAAGFDFWVRAVQNGAELPGVVEAFAASIENKIKSGDWSVQLGNTPYVGEGYIIPFDETRDFLVDIVTGGGDFYDLRNLELQPGPNFEMSTASGVQFPPITLSIHSGTAFEPEGIQFDFNNNNAQTQEDLTVILPDKTSVVSAGIISPEISGNSLGIDIVATPGAEDYPAMQWVFNNYGPNMRFFTDPTQRDIFTGFASARTLDGFRGNDVPLEAAPPEIHGFILGQDVVDAHGPQYRLYNDDFFTLDFNTARDYIVPVLKDVENNAEAIADALSGLAYDDVGAVLVQDGFDLMVWYLSVGVYLDPANTRVQRNEVDGNNVINDYELVHGLTLKNTTVNPGDPLVIDDVLTPEGDAGAFVNADNLTFDYLFL